jgi:BolA family transcriptional regulator, general stress-responsive regulator
MTTAATRKDRPERIRACLVTQLNASVVEVIDDSHLHAGHAGARDGRGHYRVRVVSDAFKGLRAIQRHQLVYRALGEMMQTDVHALSIAAFAPEETD